MTELLLSEEERLLQNMVRDYAENELAPKADELDTTHDFPWGAVKAMADLGLYGVGVEPEYGGSGGGSRHLAIVIEELARCCGATSLTYIAHTSLAIQNIHGFASHEQKEKYLPSLLSGEKIGAFCLSEPAVGSDAVSMETSPGETTGPTSSTGARRSSPTATSPTRSWSTRPRTRRSDRGG